MSFAAVCAFTACSNDEPATPAAQAPDATLSLLFNTGVTTKASTQSEAKDERIDNLTVVVFNDGAYTADASGIVEAVKTVTASDAATLDSVTNISVVSGPLKVLAIANLPSGVISSITKGKTLAEVEALTTNLSDETTHITASSAVLSVTAERGKINCMGYTVTRLAQVSGVSVYTSGETDPRIPLYRTAARISLTSVTLVQNADYPDATLTIDSVFIANVKGQAKIASDAAWGDVEYSGTDLNWFCGAHWTGIGQWKSNANAQEDASLRAVKTYTLSKDAAACEPKDTFYVYPNQAGADHTLIIVRGTYTYKLNGETMTMKDRYYTLTVNDPKSERTVSGTQHDYIMRNFQYNLSYNISGPGSDKPYDPLITSYLSTMVKVNPWNVVVVDSDVE